MPHRKDGRWLDGSAFQASPSALKTYWRNTMKSQSIELTKLVADEGMVLTNGETYSTVVYLGINDSPENWHEIPETEIPEDNGG